MQPGFEASDYVYDSNPNEQGIDTNSSSNHGLISASDSTLRSVSSDNSQDISLSPDETSNTTAPVQAITSISSKAKYLIEQVEA